MASASRFLSRRRASCTLSQSADGTDVGSFNRLRSDSRRFTSDFGNMPRCSANRAAAAMPMLTASPWGDGDKTKRKTAQKGGCGSPGDNAHDYISDAHDTGGPMCLHFNQAPVDIRYFQPSGAELDVQDFPCRRSSHWVRDFPQYGPRLPVETSDASLERQRPDTGRGRTHIVQEGRGPGIYPEFPGFSAEPAGGSNLAGNWPGGQPAAPSTSWTSPPPGSISRISECDSICFPKPLISGLSMFGMDPAFQSGIRLRFDNLTNFPMTNSIYVTNIHDQKMYCRRI